jgi:hypothetical protein
MSLRTFSAVMIPLVVLITFIVWETGLSGQMFWFLAKCSCQVDCLGAVVILL